MGRKKLNWRRLQDLNLHYQSQNLMCCPYTKALYCRTRADIACIIPAQSSA